jgi:sulfur carrier protein
VTRPVEVADGSSARILLRAVQITVNGAATEVPADLTIQELVIHLGFVEGPVAVEINRAVVSRAQHANHRVAPGDQVEIVHFVGGG